LETNKKQTKQIHIRPPFGTYPVYTHSGPASCTVIELNIVTTQQHFAQCITRPFNTSSQRTHTQHAHAHTRTHTKTKTKKTHTHNTHTHNIYTHILVHFLVTWIALYIGCLGTLAIWRLMLCWYKTLLFPQCMMTILLLYVQLVIGRWYVYMCVYSVCT